MAAREVGRRAARHKNNFNVFKRYREETLVVPTRHAALWSNQAFITCIL